MNKILCMLAAFLLLPLLNLHAQQNNLKIEWGPLENANDENKTSLPYSSATRRIELIGADPFGYCLFRSCTVLPGQGITGCNDFFLMRYNPPSTGEYVNGYITVQAASNDVGVQIFDNTGSPVTGVLTILAGNTTQVNFNFNSSDVQHEVRVVSQLTGGGSYPDIFYISALDVWVTDTTYSPYTFSISQFAVVETTYVPTADVFYVTDLDVTASPYPEKCFVSNLDVNYTVNVTRPLCSSMEEFLANTKGYRYGFNGQEKDNETYGEGNAYDFGARIYDSRIGRWMGVDPFHRKYFSWSSYNFALNSPILLRDGDGKIVIGADGRAVTYTRDSEGNVIWSSNATDDIKEIGNAMLLTKFGEASFNRWQAAKTKVYLSLDKVNEPDGYLGETFPWKKIDGYPKVNKQGNYRMIFVTIYQKAIETEICDPNSRFYMADWVEALGAVAVHEEGHNSLYQILLDYINTYSLNLPETFADPTQNIPINQEIEYRKEYHQVCPGGYDQWMSIYNSCGYKGIKSTQNDVLPVVPTQDTGVKGDTQDPDNAGFID